MDEEEKLEIYKVLNNRTVEGIKEFYLFSGIILVILSAIFGLSKYQTNISIHIIGLFIAFVWFFGTITQIKWKRWWYSRVDRIESEVFNRDKKVLAEMNSKIPPDEPKVHFTFVFSLLPIIFIMFFIFDILSPLMLRQCNYMLCVIFGILLSTLFILLLFLSYQASYLYKPKGIKEKLKDNET